MKPMRKWLALLLAGCTVLASASCGGDKHGEAVPTYTSDKEFYIGMWIGVPNAIKEYNDDGAVVNQGIPMSTEEFENHYKLIADAGFNYVEPGLNEYTTAYNIRALEAAQKYNLHQYLNDFEINALLLDEMQSEERIEAQLKDLATK